MSVFLYLAQTVFTLFAVCGQRSYNRRLVSTSVLNDTESLFIAKAYLHSLYGSRKESIKYF